MLSGLAFNSWAHVEVTVSGEAETIGKVMFYAFLLLLLLWFSSL